MRTLPLLLAAALCSCSSVPKPSAPSAPAMPPPAHLIATDGTPVTGAPEPEVVQLRKIEMFDEMKHVTVGNLAGDYVLVCHQGANKDVGVRSCLSPRPQQDYLLFRDKTKWLIKGAPEPISLKFMQDFSVIYNSKENVGLLAAKTSVGEGYGVYWLMSWTASHPNR